MHVLAQQQDESSYGQCKNADAAPEIDDEEMFTQACQYIDDHLAYPHTEHAHQVCREGVEAKQKMDSLNYC